MAKRYEVTGACVTHIPVTTENGLMLVTLYRGAVLPADVPEDRVKHLLDGNLIKQVDNGHTSEHEAHDGEQPAAVNSRSSKGDLVEYGVAQGGNRDELDALTRDQLLDRYVRSPE